MIESDNDEMQIQDHEEAKEQKQGEDLRNSEQLQRKLLWNNLVLQNLNGIGIRQMNKIE